MKRKPAAVVLWILILATAVFAKSFENTAKEIIEKEENSPVKIINFYASYKGFSPQKEYRIVSFYHNPWGKYSFLVESEHKRFWVKVDYLLKKEVATAKYEIPRGTIIRAESVTKKVLWLSPKKAKEVAAVEEAVGKVTKKEIKKAEILSLRYLAEPLLIRRGELVKVLLRTGSIEIEAVAKAMKNGRLGETVPLKNMSSGRIFSGIVVGPKKVVVR